MASTLEAEQAFARAANDFPSGWDTIAASIVAAQGSPALVLSADTLQAQALASASERLRQTQDAFKRAQALFESAQAASAGTPAEIPTNDGSIDDFLLRVSVVQARVQELEGTLQQTAPETAAAISNALNAALAKLYELTVFVRGDYDARIMADKVDETHKTTLLESVLASFREVQTSSERGFDKLSQLHVRVVELRNGTVIRLKDQAAQAVQQTQVQVDGLNRTIADTSSNVERIQDSMRQASDSMRTLQDKKHSAEQAATATDVGFGILTLGIWNLAGAIDSSKSPSAVIGLQNEINDLQRNIDSLGASLVGNMQQLTSLQAERARISETAMKQQIALAQFPGIEKAIDDNIQRLDQITTRLAVMKDVSAQLFSRMSQLYNEALSAAHESFLKKEFADAILDMCLLGAVDKPRLAEVNSIVNELTTEYGSPGLSEELQGKVSAVSTRVKEIQNRGDVLALAG